MFKHVLETPIGAVTVVDDSTKKNNRLRRRQRYSNFIFVSIFFLNEQNAKQKVKTQKQL